MATLHKANPTLLLLALTIGWVTWSPLAAQPANDLCSTATPVALGSTPFDNTGATVGTSAAPNCYTVPTNDVWFEFVAPDAATYEVDTIGSSIDTVVAVYSGSACPPGVLDQITCAAGTNAGPNPRVYFLANAGQVYWIRIVGQSFPAAPLTTFGTGVLNVTEIPVPSNDDCSTPDPLSVPGVTAFNTSAATTSPNWGCPMGPDLWYEVVAPGDGVLVFETTGLTQLSVYGAACPTQVSDELYCTFQEYTSMPVSAGQTYLLRVAPNIWSVVAAVGSLSVEFSTIPANDDCTNTTPIALGSTTPVDMIAATMDPSIEITCNLPPFGDNLLYADRWYSVVPTTDGVLTVDLSQNPDATPYHVVYALPSGATCPAIGDEVNCSQPRFSATPVTAGQTYVIRVGTSYDGQFYSGDMTVDLITALPNDECTGATVMVPGDVALVDTSLASISSGYSCVIEGDIWYEITAPTNGVLYTSLTLDEIGSHVIYHAPGGPGTCPSDTDEITCAQFQDISSVVVIAGETYMIRISGTQFAGPVIGTIQVELFLPDPNDDCAQPVTVTAPSVVPFNTIAASGSPTLGGCLAPMAKDVWFEITSPVDGTMLLDIDGPATHAIYNSAPGGPCPTTSDQIDCIDAPFFSSTPVLAGQTYRIQIGHFAGYPGVIGNFSIEIEGPPANDDCIGAQFIGAVPSNTIWDTTGATDDTNGLGGGPGCAFGPFFDVWYRFVAPTSGLMEFEFTAGGNGWSSFVIYEDATGGQVCPTFADAIACRQGGNSDTFTVVGGASYYVRVGRGAPTSPVIDGAFSLDYLLSDPQQVICDTSVADEITGSYVIAVGSDYDLGVEVYVDGILEATIPQTQTSYTHALPFGTVGVVEMGFRGLSSNGNTQVVTCTGAFGAPVNDLCSGVIPVGLGTVAFDNAGTSTDSTAPPFACGNGSSDLWYEFVAPETAIFRATTCGAVQFDSVVEVYDGSTGCPTFGASAIACNDFAPNCPLSNAEVEWSAVVGQVYYIRLGGGTNFNGSTGSGELTIQIDCFGLTGLTCDYDCTTNTVTLNWDAGSHISYSVESDPGGVLSPGQTAATWTGPAPATGEIIFTVTGECAIGSFSSAFCTAVAVDLTTTFDNLVLELEGEAGAVDSAQILGDALLDLGESYTILPLHGFDQFPCFDTLVGPAQRIWVMNGTYPEDYHLTEGEGDFLASLLQSGKHIYLEGADHWGFLHIPSDLDDVDGVDFVEDGDFTFTTMDGLDSGLADGDFSNYVDVSYQQDSALNESTDHLAPTTGVPGMSTGAIWKNSPDGTIGETDYVTAILTRSGGSGTMISSSWEFGGFGGDHVALAADYLALLQTPPGTPFVRGDCNSDGGVNIADGVFLLAELFSGGPSGPCADACDHNDDGGKNIADAIYLLATLFSGGPPPPAPGNTCGLDPTADALDCVSSTGGC